MDDSAAGGLLILAILLGLYLLPAIIGSSRKHRQAAAIWVLNVFLGWTLIGWVAALVWASTQPGTSPPPIPTTPDGRSIADPKIMVANGIGSRLTFDGSEITISRHGATSFMVHGFDGQKGISVSSITSIQFKSAGSITSGFIQFAFQGGLEAKGGLFEAAADENSVLFTAENQPAFERIRDAIKQRQAELQQSRGVTAPSGADELIKFAALRDQGVITEEEFLAKKAKILDL